MSLTRETRRQVDAHRRALHEEYAAAPVFEESFEISRERFDDMARVAPDGYLHGGAAFVVAEGNLLLQRRADTGEWGVPGGGWEDGETFAETAVREVREETGIECSVVGLRVHHHQRWVAAERDETIHSLGAFFEADYLDGTLRATDDDVDEVGWFTSLPADVATVVERFAVVGDEH